MGGQVVFPSYSPARQISFLSRLVPSTPSYSIIIVVYINRLG